MRRLSPRACLGFVLAAVMACVAACGGQTPTSPADTGLRVSISTLAHDLPPLFVGRARYYNASLVKADGYSSLTPCTTWRWQSSNPAVASVSISETSTSSATVTGVAVGTAVISATCWGNGLTGTQSVDVHRICTLSGTVKDDLGSPVEGASVEATAVRRGAQTDASGRYVITELPDGFTSAISVSKWGYQSVSKGPVTVLTDMVVDFTMPRGVRLYGTVREAGVGTLAGATVEIISGPGAGQVVTSTLSGAYQTPWLLPGTFTLRASKIGYDPVEHTVTTAFSTLLDFALTRSYGSCLALVSPVVFDPFPSAGGDVATSVTANPGRGWTASSNDSWIQVLSGASGTGPATGTLRFRVLSSEGNADIRRGAIAIRCAGAEGESAWGQDVRVAQFPACHAHVEWAPSSPTVFPPSGGIPPLTGLVRVTTGTPNCYWRATTDADWIHLSWAPYPEEHGDGSVTFSLDVNATGRDRTATIVIAEVPWSVTQKGQ